MAALDDGSDSRVMVMVMVVDKSGWSISGNGYGASSSAVCAAACLCRLSLGARSAGGARECSAPCPYSALPPYPPTHHPAAAPRPRPLLRTEAVVRRHRAALCASRAPPTAAARSGTGCLFIYKSIAVGAQAARVHPLPRSNKSPFGFLGGKYELRPPP